MLHIDFWKEEDRGWLKVAIRGFLQAGFDRGGDVLPTEKNVECYLKLGFNAVDRGDPCLVAFLDGMRVGFVYWLGIANPQLDQRWKTIHAMGSYTDPCFRSHGVADALRLTAERISKEKGYERIFGPVQTANEKGVRVFVEHYQAKICVVEFEKFI